jgi:hypothetical protein
VAQNRLTLMRREGTAAVPHGIGATRPSLPAAPDGHRDTAGARWPDAGPAFRAYVEQFLARSLAPGDVMVLDNLAAHRVDGIRQALAASYGST